MVCRLFDAELSFLSYQTNIHGEPFRKSSMKFELEHITINQMKYIWKCNLQNV